MNDEIARLNVPRWLPRAAGGWHRVWVVSFERHPQSDDLDAIGRMATPELGVRASRSPNDLRAIDIETWIASDPTADENFYYSAYRLFTRIDQEVGRISTIQSQPRELWAPFRAGRGQRH